MRQEKFDLARKVLERWLARGSPNAVAGTISPGLD